MSNNVKNNKIYYIVSGLLVFLIPSAIVFFSSGYRFTNGLHIGKNGYLALTLPLADTSVFINESRKLVSTKENEILKVSLSPREHSIIVSHQDFYPWKKEIKISEGETKNISPIFVFQNPSGSIITKDDPEYIKIINEINNNFPPKKDEPKKSKDGSVTIWLEENKIMAKKEENTFEVTSLENPVRNIDFYKNRNDSVVFSSGNGVYVIEIYKDGTQNFMPIYKGEKPTFLLTDENFIFIQDFQNLMQVII